MTRKRIELDGQAHTYAEWARLHGMSPVLLCLRLKSGFDLATALAKPVKKYRKHHTYQGELRTTRELEAVAGVPIQLISVRLHKGWTVAEAVETPVDGSRRTVTVSWKAKEWKLADLAKHVGMNYHVLHSRLFRHKLGVQEAITRPVRVIKKRIRTRSQVAQQDATTEDNL